MEKTKTSPLSFIKKWCYDKRLYFLVFFLPVAIMFSAYAFFKIHPIGDSSVLVLDLNGQYVYYYEQFRDAFHGNGSFIYNWSRNLSGEMFGVFAYYLASPFMLILVLLPRTMMATSILILQLAKIGTAAVTFMFFLKRYQCRSLRLSHLSYSLPCMLLCHTWWYNLWTLCGLTDLSICRLYAGAFTGSLMRASLYLI